MQLELEEKEMELKGIEQKDADEETTTEVESENITETEMDSTVNSNDTESTTQIETPIDTVIDTPQIPKTMENIETETILDDIKKPEPKVSKTDTEINVEPMEDIPKPQETTTQAASKTPMETTENTTVPPKQDDINVDTEIESDMESQTKAKKTSETVSNMKIEEELEDNEAKTEAKTEAKEEAKKTKPKELAKYKPTIWMRIQDIFGNVFIYPNYFLHGANGLAICAMFMGNMLHLRMFSVFANLLAVVFYANMTPKLIVPLFWAVFFCLGHLTMILLLLLEKRTVQMTDEEHNIYNNSFREYGFTPVQFKSIIKIARTTKVNQGQIIATQGSIERYVFYVIKGEFELKKNDIPVGYLTDGVFVGELLNDINLQQRIKNKTDESIVTNEQQGEIIQYSELINTAEQNQAIHMSALMNQDIGLVTHDINKAISSKEAVEEESKHNMDINPDINVDITKNASNINTTQNEDELKTTEPMDTQDAKKLSIFKNLFEKDEQNSNKWQHTITAMEPCIVLCWDSNELHKHLSSNNRLKDASIKAMYGDMKHKLDLNKQYQVIRAYYDILKVVTFDDVISSDTKKRLETYRRDNNITLKQHTYALNKIGWTLDEYIAGKKLKPSIFRSFVGKLDDWYTNKLVKSWKN